MTAIERFEITGINAYTLSAFMNHNMSNELRSENHPSKVDKWLSIYVVFYFSD